MRAEKNRDTIFKDDKKQNIEKTVKTTLSAAEHSKAKQMDEYART